MRPCRESEWRPGGPIPAAARSPPRRRQPSNPNPGTTENTPGARHQRRPRWQTHNKSEQMFDGGSTVWIHADMTPNQTKAGETRLIPTNRLLKPAAAAPEYLYPHSLPQCATTEMELEAIK